jgi:hypothetical protein
LSGRLAEGFAPSLQYSDDGDFITYYFSNAECYGHRVDDLLTVYLSMDGDELVGCKVKGVAHILGKLGSFGIDLHETNIKLSLLFIGGAFVSEPGDNIEYYRRLAEWTKLVPLGADLLRKVA